MLVIDKVLNDEAFIQTALKHGTTQEAHAHIRIKIDIGTQLKSAADVIRDARSLSAYAKISRYDTFGIMHNTAVKKNI